VDLDEYMENYNNERTHQGKRCKGRTPMETFIEGKELYNQKNIEKMTAAV
jgi:gluconate kinase